MVTTRSIHISGTFTHCSQMGIRDECMATVAVGSLHTEMDRDGINNRVRRAIFQPYIPVFGREWEFESVTMEYASCAPIFMKWTNTVVQHKKKQLTFCVSFQIWSHTKFIAPSPKHIYYNWWKSLCLRAQRTRTKQFHRVHILCACFYLCFAFGCV